MDCEQIILGVINIVGGTLVIGSYVVGIRLHPSTRDSAWGGIPAPLKLAYIFSMLLAAAGYFAFSNFIIFRLDPEYIRDANSFGYSMFILVYCLVLFPSALWMPLTFRMLDKPNRILWYAIRLTLAVVGIGSLGLLALLIIVNHNEATWVYGLAIAGSVAFCIQTAVLDALVWPWYFPTKR
jgi:hypothetical protein